ncbi:MAG TPA: hypothetical protein VIR31_05950 [Nitrososphaeraceae archaeon]
MKGGLSIMDINDVKNVAAQVYASKKAVDKNYAEVFKVAYNELLKALHERTAQPKQSVDDLFKV